MKKIFLAMTAIAMMASLEVSAQSKQFKYGTTADSTVCKNNLSFYNDYVKQKQFLAALPAWRKAYSTCPATASQNLYINGARILKAAISAEKDQAHKKALIDTLMNVYKIRIENFPKNVVSARNSMAADFIFYNRKNFDEVYKLTEEVVEGNQKETSANVLVNNLNAAVELYKAEKLDAEKVINTYERNIALLAEGAPEKDAIESLFISSKVASCDNLIALFTPRYEANPDDYELVSNIVRMMNTADGCANNDLYLNAVTSMHKISPSYKSAYGLYKLNSVRGNYDEAVKYLEEAIASDETDAVQDGDYNFELAVYSFKSGKNAKAYAAAEKAASLSPAVKGKAYLLMGQIWGSTVCGGNEIERRAPYWVAVDYLQKAKAADESLTEEANKLISSYAAYYPLAAEAFMYDVQNGQSYTVSCGGMRATTTVRTQK